MGPTLRRARTTSAGCSNFFSKLWGAAPGLTTHYSPAHREMYPRASWPAGDVCWKCRWRLASQRRRFAHRALLRTGIASDPAPPLTQRRAFHATRPVCPCTHPALRSILLTTSQASQAALSSASALPRIDPALLHPSLQQKLPIRERLHQWQQHFGGPDEETLNAFENHPARGDIQNNLSKLNYGTKADEDDGENEFGMTEDNKDEELITIGLFLKPGDVVELSYVLNAPRSVFIPANPP